MPGAAWRVEAAGRVLSAGAVGHAVLAPSREAAAPGTPYDLASLTKPLATAVLALVLEQEGGLDLAAPARRWLPELAGSEWAEAPLLDLGAHRAGLPSWRPLYLGASTQEGYARAVAREERAAPPGATLYSDLGYVLLGIAVERAAGERLPSLFDRLVSRPLGLGAIGFATGPGRFRAAAATEAEPEFERRMAGEGGAGFAWRASIPRGEVHDGNAHGLGGAAGHAGLFGTAADVAALARAVLEPSLPGLDASAARRLLEPVAGEGSRPFGFTLAALSDAARGVLPESSPGHNGFTGTSVWIEPRLGAVYVLLTNRVHPRVPDADFQPVRREFLRIAAAVAGAGAR